MNIFGVVRISHYILNLSDGTHKEIFLLGDEHTIQENNCEIPNITVLDLLDQFIHQNPNITIDLFVETDMFEDEYIPSEVNPELFLVQSWEKFRVCLNKNKEKCKKRWPNLRYHYTDIRGLITPELTNWCAMFLRIPLHELEQIDRQKLYDSIYSKMVQMIKHHQEIPAKVMKQWNECPMWSMQVYTDLANDMRREVENTIRLINKFYRITHKDFYRMSQAIVQNMMNASTLMMDMYTLGRIFREFQKDGWNARNIIVYAGDTHITTYKNALESVGAQLISESEVDGYCQQLESVIFQDSIESKRKRSRVR